LEAHSRKAALPVRFAYCSLAPCCNARFTRAPLKRNALSFRKRRSHDSDSPKIYFFLRLPVVNHSKVRSAWPKNYDFCSNVSGMEWALVPQKLHDAKLPSHVTKVTGRDILALHHAPTTLQDSSRTRVALILRPTERVSPAQDHSF